MNMLDDDQKKRARKGAILGLTFSLITKFEVIAGNHCFGNNHMVFVGGIEMGDKKVFCYECRDDVTYTVTEVDLIGKLKEIEYTYDGKVARCNNCGSEVYVPEIIDLNLKTLYDVYRKEHNIISLEDIAEIPTLYAIGKRPLSMLLGWGEHTFSRYLDGHMPTKQYSNILKNIHDDPEIYSKILEENKENLKSKIAYKKSRKKVEKIIQSSIVE
jgi:putative zinc finger/helix-turn-helix YgiT family protein